jgi:short-subunit dehydrogenase
MSLPPPTAESTVLVTGASAGIGAELARELARRGYPITLVARRRERLERLAADVEREHGVRAHVHACDLADPQARADLVAALQEGEREVAGLCNNAGLGTFGHFLDQDRRRERELIEINLLAVWELTGALLPAMVARGRGAVLNVGSSAGFQPFPGHATYAATKSFVNTFSEALHQELKGTGVTCTVLCPGPVKTEFFDSQPAAYEAAPKPLRISAAAVARQAVDAMVGGRRVVVPGVMAKSLVTQARFVPRSILLPIWDRVMRGVVRAEADDQAAEPRGTSPLS